MNTWEVGKNVSFTLTSYNAGGAAPVAATMFGKITSAAFPFNADSPTGNVVNVTAGTNFTVARYEIVKMSGTAAIFDKPVGGAAGSSGAGRLGGCTTRIGDIGTGSPQSGHVLWMRSGTVFTATQQITINADSRFPVKVIGYGTVRGDGARALMTAQANTSLSVSGSHIHLYNLEIDGANLSAGLVSFSGSHCLFQNIWAHSCSASGHIWNISGAQSRWRFCKTSDPGTSVGTALLTTSGGGGSLKAQNEWEFCEFDCEDNANSIAVIITDGGFQFKHCYFIRCGSHAIHFNEPRFGTSFTNCVIWDNVGDGCRITASIQNNNSYRNIFFVRCIIGKNDGYDFNAQGTLLPDSRVPELTFSMIKNCAFLTQGLGRYNQFDGTVGESDITLTVDPFVASAARDFVLNELPGGGTLCRFTVSFLSETTQFESFVGLVPPAGIVEYDAAAFAPNPQIDHVRFPEGISYGSVGGPVWQTIIVDPGSGAEQRFGLVQYARHKYNVAHGVRTALDGAALTSFFNARRGMLRAFRFKDWNDFEATDQDQFPTGSRQLKFVKAYESGDQVYLRPIAALVSGTLTMKRAGVDYTGFTMDYNNGIATLTPDVTFNISAITLGATTTITTTANHSFTPGQVIYLTAISGPDALNDQIGVITAVPANNQFTLDINSTGYPAYISGGTASKYLQPGEDVTASFEFDVAVRFDTDAMELMTEDLDIRAWTDIPLIEVFGSDFGSVEVEEIDEN
jgi:uncharacterized protein (TIGR02217 family)